MKLIEIDKIKVAPNRQRKAFDPTRLHELKDSIERLGLQNALVLRVVGDGYQLVSGERRLRAITDIYALGGSFRYDGEAVRENFVPYSLFDELDPLAAEEAELEENTCRADLTMQERCAAHLRLFNLRAKQAAASGSPPPTVKDLSLEIRDSGDGFHQEATRRELIVGRNLGNPAIAAAKTVDEAFKILRKEDQQAKDRALGETVGRTFTADLHTARNEDSLLWLADCSAERFDVILTDPPYGMGADEFGDSGGRAEGAHGYEDSAVNFERILAVCGPHFARITKPQAHLYWFCDIDWFPTIRESLESCGWWVFRTPLIWHKPGGMRAPWPEHGPQRKYETILYAVKGKRAAMKLGGDVITCSPDDNLGHAAQKPVGLFTELLSRSVHPGDAVLDPFMGSGTIFPAAHGLKCKATGIEMDTASYGIAVKRIEKLKEEK